jgi:cysteine desulfurase
VEHHAVLYPVLALKKEFGIQVDFLNILSDGSIDVTHLVELLSQDFKTLVSLMHVNNELGVVLDLERIAIICKEHNALFHSDTVQSVGKTEIDLKVLPIDFMSASAHKFHGPKGIGFAFIRKNSGLQPLLIGGEQEKGMRGGTESIGQVAGMAKALEIAYANLEKERAYITDLKLYCIAQLTKFFPDLKIIGASNGFYNIINVILPLLEDKTGMLLFHLDIKGVAVSRGSACQSGSGNPSHVLAEILSPEDLTKPSLRISFSHYNTKEDIDYLIAVLKTA